MRFDRLHPSGQWAVSGSEPVFLGTTGKLIDEYNQRTTIMGYDFEKDVFPAELQEIIASRQHRLGPSAQQPLDPEHPNRDAERLKLMGLAFSGGGIRSATFNLGVIHALARLGLLKQFDYLSTVSGGGYIGSWLSAWSKREKGGIKQVEDILARAEEGEREPEEVRFLRDYSNYLTPESSFLSADTWTAVATYIRNAFLNLLVLFFAFAAVLLLPRCLTFAAMQLADLSSWNHFVGLSAFALLVWAMVWIGTNLAVVAAGIKSGKDPAYVELAAVQRRIIIPVLVSALLATWWLGLRGFGDGWTLWRWALLLGGVYVALCIVGTLFGGALAKRTQGITLNEDGNSPPHPVKNLFWAFLAGAVGGLLLYGLAELIDMLASMYVGSSTPLILSVGPLLLLLLAATVVTLHIGFTGRLLKPEVQEWWLRLSAWLTIYGMGWIGLFVAALFAPILIFKLWNFSATLSATTLIGWIATTVAGVVAGKNPNTGKEGGANWMDAVAKIAPYVFIAGFVGLISLLLHLLLLAWFGGARGIAGDWPAYFAQLADTSGIGPVWVFLVCAAVALVLSLRVDINLFSLHYYYRNRLIRCYLGASRGGSADRGGERRANPFTGFDPEDNLSMADLSITPRPNAGPDENPYLGPYHIVNTALNLVHGDRLATQQRKATSYVFTPKYCGYSPWTGVQGYRETWACTQSEGTPPDNPTGPSLGTALAISGAAFTPNMGYHSSPAVAFLLTVFSVRLGVWFGNPLSEEPEFPAFGGQPTWQRQSPTFSLPYLVFELFGLANDRRGFVSLSDGGHFENLGIYELIRRRCNSILVIDAGQDGSYGFEDLGGAIRKCRIDFDTEIIIDVTKLCPRKVRKTERRHKGEQYSDAHYAVGTIVYPDRTLGTLVYLKPTLTGDEETDIRNYASEHPDFPHQSTTDQWFDESQFESYRKLGSHIAGQAFAGVAEKLKGGGLTLETAMQEIRKASGLPPIN